MDNALRWWEAIHNQQIIKVNNILIERSNAETPAGETLPPGREKVKRVSIDATPGSDDGKDAF
ncbi:MAG: hypothetical protein RQ885_03000 [Desulfurococcales archaeon]|jgi:hypothetical protein|nr:hypothetical protein [Desulfurococcales archaeon]